MILGIPLSHLERIIPLVEKDLRFNFEDLNIGVEINNTMGLICELGQVSVHGDFIFFNWITKGDANGSREKKILPPEDTYNKSIETEFVILWSLVDREKVKAHTSIELICGILKVYSFFFLRFFFLFITMHLLHAISVKMLTDNQLWYVEKNE